MGVLALTKHSGIRRSRRSEPAKLITHRIELNDILQAYETFGNAAKEHALKVILTNK